MNILFITAHPYLPQMFGGLQTSTDQLCRYLKALGHKTSVLSALMPDDALGRTGRLKLRGKKLLMGVPAVCDHTMSYPVWRAWYPWEAVEGVVKGVRPDIIVVMAAQPAKMGLAARACGVPLMLQLQDVEFNQHGGDMNQLRNVHAIANSQFTADTYRHAFGIQADVIYPFINDDEYTVETTRECVTFINPHMFKGLPVALAVARACPHIPFTFLETWPLKGHERQSLEQDLRTLPNVTLLPPQKDMRPVYAKTKILLAPSLWLEGYGRVVSEAQLSGIPVVASARGGLPEAVGPGGILLDPEGDLQGWISAVETLWADQNRYEALSAAAASHARRLELSLDHHLEAWERAIQTAIKKGRAASSEKSLSDAEILRQPIVSE